MTIEAIRAYALERLERELSPVFQYHSIRHTLDVHAAVVEFGTAEGVDAALLRCLEAAAYFHDLGYVSGCVYGHEDYSARIAERQLRKRNWAPADVETVARLVRVTRLERGPADLPEAIIRDADVEYLGRAEAGERSRCFRREMELLGYRYGDREWLGFELQFFSQLQFYTSACRERRQAGFERFAAELAARHRELEDTEC